MLESKYIAYFFDEVTNWQQKLNNADATINAWFRVQRAWMHLESIFIGSEDIRSQLPEETKRFEKIDKDFKVIIILIIYIITFYDYINWTFSIKDLLKEMVSNLNIIKSTNKPKLLDRLEQLEIQLNICEKALSDYLETKRLAYPRFYFISSADLLDILSNGKTLSLSLSLSLSLMIRNFRKNYIYFIATGNNPELVCKHLSKLYDSLAKLQWKIEEGKPTKHANRMIAKDGEEMALYGTCDCTGKV